MKNYQPVDWNRITRQGHTFLRIIFDSFPVLEEFFRPPRGMPGFAQGCQSDFSIIPMVVAHTEQKIHEREASFLVENDGIRNNSGLFIQQ